MKKLYIILLAAVFTAGCSDDKTGESLPEVQLSVSTHELLFQATGDIPDGENVLLVTSSDDWRLSGKKTWCRPSATEGQSGQSITFVADPNPDSESRSITYSFICGNKTQKVVVTQEASSVLDFATATSFNVPVTGGPISVIVKSTEDMTYTIDAKYEAWIKPNVTRAVQTNFLAFNISANPTFGPRSGEILFSVEGKEVPVTILQAQTDKVDVPITDYAVDPEGETVSVNYAANVEIVPDLTEYPWITLLSNSASVSLSPGTLVFEVESAKKSRTAQVSIKSTDRLTTYATLTFSQAAAPVTAMIPDANFRAWLVSQGYVTETGTPNKCELTNTGLAVSTFSISGQGIASLEGIAAFETLMTLDCSNNLLTVLDLSAPSRIATLNCESNNIKVLNLMGCMPFASMGTGTSSALRVTKNNLEEVYLADNWDKVNFGVAGAGRLTGKSGVGSKILKVIGQSVPKVLCGLTGTLETVDITECPGLTAFSGGGNTDKTVKTIYITAAQEKIMNDNPINWTKPSGAQYVVK